jgi:polyisoprenoid-binding protein YceI
VSDQGSASGQTSAEVAAVLADGTVAGDWVLDPAGSRVEFHVKHFWGAVTVHGTFETITGQGTVGEDGTVTGRLTMDGASVNTRSKPRDKHLRSADFFDTDNHRDVVITLTEAKPDGPATLACQGTLEAAGHNRPIEFTARVQEASAQAVVLNAEITIDRTAFDMTWSPLGMAAAMAEGTVLARFVRP